MSPANAAVVRRNTTRNTASLPPACNAPYRKASIPTNTRSGKKLARSIVGEDEKGYDTLQVISELEEQMREAASKLEFERAAHLRDQIQELKDQGTLTP